MLAQQHIAEVGELQLTLAIPPGGGRTGLMDETPMWGSMAAQKTLAKVGTKHMNAKKKKNDKQVIINSFVKNGW